MRGFYSPIDKLAADIPRTKGTGAEFMTELSKRPGYKTAEAEDRNLQTLMALPKMERAQFLQALKAKPAPSLEESERVERPQDRNDARTKYEDYTIPGGENYREILLNMPHDPNRKQSPSSSHWDSPDVLAHVRAKDRAGPNGEKVLHLEEIQSDWHQAGREKGYQSPDAKAARIKALRERGLAAIRLENHKREMAVTDAYLASDAPMWQQPEAKARLKARQAEQNKVLMDLLPKAMRADTEYQKALKAEHDTVPDAPFKKNWHELALKKMIHHAATNGYDSIAITPGAEQVKRYGLSKHVGRITHMTHLDNPDKGILFAFDPKGNQIAENHNIFHKDLPRYIGKEGAQKLLAQKPDENGYRELSGQNLEVGGEGMKGFYDKMIPSFLNQFGKKYGAKVGTTSITPGMTAGEVFDNHYGEVRRAIRNGDFGGQQFIAEKMAEINKPVAVHTFPITPEMREDVTKNGVPLYAEGGEVKRIYHGSHSKNILEVKDSGVFGGLFGSPSKQAAESHGPHLHYADIPEHKILTHYALNYELPHAKISQALIKASPKLAKDKELRNKVWDVVVGDKGQATHHIGEDELSSMFGTSDAGEAALEAQRLRGQVSKHLGHHAVELEDEHGTSYLIHPGVKMHTYAEGGKVDVRPTVKDDTLQRKIPEIEEAAKALQTGIINRKDYDKVVNKHKPVKPYTFVPQPASDEDAERALMANKKPHWRGHQHWPAGRKVGLRLDIPAYETHGVWVNSIHDEEGKGEDKQKTSYGPVSSVKNATFDAGPAKGIKVATGEDNKSPFARIHGELHHMTEDDAVEHMKTNLNHPDYAQVGMDPRRHGFFYDRKSMKPVTHSAHVVQIGPLVLAHKPTYGKREAYADGGSVMGINVASDRKSDRKYADMIVDGHKTFESRNSDTLRPYVGKRVAIVRTGEGKAKAIGEVTIGEPTVVNKQKFRALEDKHHVPEGSAFDIGNNTKHLYPLSDPVRYEQERDVGHGIVARKVLAHGGDVSRETIKPVGHGYTREQVTVAPNLDAMKYELMSVKHFAKKAK